MIRPMCVKFTYDKAGTHPDNFETFAYYEALRQFLDQHLGHALWFKGQALLAFHPDITSAVLSFFSRQLPDGGYIRPTHTYHFEDVVHTLPMDADHLLGYLRLEDGRTYGIKPPSEEWEPLPPTPTETCPWCHHAFGTAWRLLQHTLDPTEPCWVQRTPGWYRAARERLTVLVTWLILVSLLLRQVSG